MLGLGDLVPRFVLGRGRLALAAGDVGGTRRDCVDADMFEDSA